MRLPPSHEAALVWALHSTEGAEVRWAGANRLDDAGLMRRIGEEFGISGGFGWDGVWVEYRGGINPRIEICVGADTPMELFGRELLAAVREALKITRPGELF